MNNDRQRIVQLRLSGCGWDKVPWGDNNLTKEQYAERPGSAGNDWGHEGDGGTVFNAVTFQVAFYGPGNVSQVSVPKYSDVWGELSEKWVPNQKASKGVLAGNKTRGCGC